MDTFTTFGISDASWNIIRHLFAVKTTGRPREHEPRAILNAIFYIAKTACQWNLLPNSFPPWKTVYNYFRRWCLAGIIENINDLLRSAIRLIHGKGKPKIIVIDSQSVKTTSMAKTIGYDGNKKIKGKKRHVMVDSLGLVEAFPKLF